ncbi:hypothetical protein N7456_010845 [Penicillium angulare]|uniref:Uncharacterized protein n=1 Tax=Penicillium angulare TaxID=116970 RepID=A0A9W9ESU1_9EURO|nr:hypothetical protein N7456_010845 [Penicillium angulare]
MSNKNDKSGEQKSRDSIDSILSYYENHGPADQHLKSAKRASSGEIQGGVSKGDILSPEAMSELQGELNDDLEIHDTISMLTEEEKEVMVKAAEATIARRKKKK